MRFLFPASSWTRLAVWLGIGLVFGATASGEKSQVESQLRFSSESINRYSLDHLPRSLSIRQGETWFGYDLERAKVYKTWRSPPGKSGLQSKGFVVRSTGETLFEDKSESTWRLRRAGHEIPLRARYLGVAERGAGPEKHFILTWELRHDAGRVELLEKVPAESSSRSSPTRFLRVATLAAGESLVPATPTIGVWKMAGASGKNSENPALTGEEWHELTLSSPASSSRK